MVLGCLFTRCQFPCLGVARLFMQSKSIIEYAYAASTAQDYRIVHQQWHVSAGVGSTQTLRRFRPVYVILPPSTVCEIPVNHFPLLPWYSEV